MAGSRHLFLALLCSVAATLLGATEQWWDTAWSFRRKITVPPPSDSRADAFWTEFLTGGRMQPDGADLRVVAEGRETPHLLIFLGQGDICRLAAKLLPGVTTYHVYFGNPRAREQPTKWQPTGGLLLETREYRGGSFRSWPEMRAVLDKSAGHLYGRGYVSNVFHGHNLFGPSEQYVSIYTGFIIAPQDGEYSFATTSDDASFLFVDDKEVVSWGGYHHAVPFARHQRTIRLSKGLHRFAYYHVNVGGPEGRAVAAWCIPGGKFEVIPPHAFLPIAHGKAGRLEELGAEFVPDFIFRHAGEVHTEKALLIRMRFEDQTQLPANARARFLWDFGDGLTGEGRIVEHIYLRSGLRTVRLTANLDGTQRTTCNRVNIDANWERQTEPLTDTVSEYVATVRRYPFHQLLPGDLVGAGRFFADAEAWPELLRVAEVAFPAKGSSSSEAFAELIPLLRRAAIYETRLTDEVIERLRNAELLLASAQSKALCALELGDILLKKQEPLGAEAAYHRVIEQYAPGAPPPSIRRARIGLGDCHRYRRNAERAIQEYRLAEAIHLDTQPLERHLVRVGVYALAVEDYLRRNEFDAAQELLDQWEWERPSDKLLGHSTVLRARLYQARRQLREAIRELETLLAVNPKSAYADRALHILAECYLRLTPPDNLKAADALRTLLDEHPESPLAAEARATLQKLLPK